MEIHVKGNRGRGKPKKKLMDRIEKERKING